MPDRANIGAVLRETTPWRSGDERRDSALDEARQRLEARSSKLLDSLRDQGIEPSAISAGSISVQRESRSNDNGAADATPVSERLVIERRFDIELSELSRLPTTLDALFATGVDSLEGIRYDVGDREKFEDRALRQALERARQKAQLIADTLSTGLGEVVRVEEVGAPVMRPMMVSAMRSQAAGSSADYSPGTISVEATVSASWTLDGAEVTP